jgi:hypothetical protein
MPHFDTSALLPHFICPAAGFEAVEVMRFACRQVRCENFNGQEVCNLATFAEMVDSCTDKYMKFGLEGGKLVILDRLQANADALRILQQHAITFDRSADLR